MSQRSVCLSKCFNVLDYQIKYQKVLTSETRFKQVFESQEGSRRGREVAAKSRCDCPLQGRNPAESIESRASQAGADRRAHPSRA